MSDPTLFAWLKLLYAFGLNPAVALALVQQVGSVETAVDLSVDELVALGIKFNHAQNLAQPDADFLDRHINWATTEHHHIVHYHDSRYPNLLREIEDPPLVLFVCGEPALLVQPQIAMVGSRNATPQGLENAAAFSHYLAERGFIITSGLARGIDAASHHGALSASGLTIAVCGTGLDQVYPGTHTKLTEQIAQTGAVVSEFPLKTGVKKMNFPRRNRIISGLSVGTLVVEAAQRSGSLITARLAGEQGRDIFAIPGSIHNPMARGCHQLIQQGAKLVERGRDIVEELGNLTQTVLDDNQIQVEPYAQGISDLDTDYDKLLQSLGVEPSTVNQVCGRTGLTAEAVSSMLLILELRGYVSATTGGRYERSILRERK